MDQTVSFLKLPINRQVNIQTLQLVARYRIRALLQRLPLQTAGLTSQAKAKEGRVVQEQHRQQHWESVTRRRPTDKAYATPEIAIFVSSGLLRIYCSTPPHPDVHFKMTAPTSQTGTSVKYVYVL